MIASFTAAPLACTVRKIEFWAMTIAPATTVRKYVWKNVSAAAFRS